MADGLSPQALRHPYFSSSPPPTPSAKLPKPTAALVPRALPPDEIQRTDMAQPRDSKKRKPEGAQSMAEQDDRLKKVARKLDFTAT